MLKIVSRYCDLDLHPYFKPILVLSQNEIDKVCVDNDCSFTLNGSDVYFVTTTGVSLVSSHVVKFIPRAKPGEYSSYEIEKFIDEHKPTQKWTSLTDQLRSDCLYVIKIKEA